MGVLTPIPRRLFDLSEYYRMAESGILREGGRVELIEGEIVTMSPIGSRHPQARASLSPPPTSSANPTSSVCD
jgi:hypothetical protein